MPMGEYSFFGGFTSALALEEAEVVLASKTFGVTPLGRKWSGR